MRAGSATVPGRRCTKLSPIESLLQYRFATPKPLKARPGPGGCRIARLCKPLPLALHCAGSVLAVKGPLRRFAPWTASGRSEDCAVYEGKGGLWVCVVVGFSGRVRAERNLSAIPDA